MNEYLTSIFSQADNKTTTYCTKPTLLQFMIESEMYPSKFSHGSRRLNTQAELLDFMKNEWTRDRMFGMISEPHFSPLL